MSLIRTILVKVGGDGYPIVIGAGAAGRLRDLCRVEEGEMRLALAADARVAELHLGKLVEYLPRVEVQTMIPAGEGSKSIEQLTVIHDALAEARITRSDLVIAFGGGVIGDLTGFAAATWMRGTAFVQVPTTLLAAIDASCGGKTGINHASGKNLIGAFHQPRAVVVDLDFLATLSERDYRAGLAESVKHAAISGEEFLEWHEKHIKSILRRDSEALTELIARNCKIKAEVVAKDEREAGPRMVLNYGHTIGHAIEHLLEYELLHGECVALGMLAENELARSRGALSDEIADRISALLGELGLPSESPRGLCVESAMDVIALDKKSRGGKTLFTLLRSPGAPMIVDDISAREIADAMAVVQP